MDALYFKLKRLVSPWDLKKKSDKNEIYKLNFISFNKHKNKTNVEYITVLFKLKQQPFIRIDMDVWILNTLYIFYATYYVL